MAAEAKIEKAVCDYAEERGFLVRKLQWGGRRDAPDRFFAHLNAQPRSFMIEFKAPGEMARPGQAREAGKLRSHGVTVYICDLEAAGKGIIDASLTDIL